MEKPVKRLTLLFILTLSIFSLCGMEVGEDEPTEEQHKFEQNVKEIELQDSHIPHEPELLLDLTAKFIITTLINKIKNNEDYEPLLNQYLLNTDMEDYLISALYKYGVTFLWQFSPYIVEFLDCTDFFVDYGSNYSINHYLLDNDLLLEICCYYLPDRKKLLSIKIWNLKTKSCLKELTLHDVSVLEHLLSNNSTLVALICKDKSILIYNLETGERITIPENEIIENISFAYDDKYICVGSGNGRISLKDISTGIEVCSMNASSYIKVKCINDMIFVFYRDKIEGYRIYINQDNHKFIKISESNHHFLSEISALGNKLINVTNVNNIGYKIDIHVLDTASLKQISTIHNAITHDLRINCNRDGNLLLVSERPAHTISQKIDGVSLYDGILGKLVRKIDFNQELLKLNLNLSEVLLTRFDISADNRSIIVYGGSHFLKISLNLNGNLRCILKQIKTAFDDNESKN